MSETQVENKTFKSLQVGIKPTLSNVGRVTEVKDAKVSKSEKYIVVPITIDAFGAGESTTIYWLFRPDWLTYDFDPSKLEDNAAEFVFKQNMLSDEQLSALAALAGTPENLSVLCYRLSEIPPYSADNEINYLADITRTLKEFFAEFNPQIGYVLKQKLEKVDGEYRRTKYYQVDRFFYPTDDNLDIEKARAQKSEEKLSRLSDEDRRKKVPYKVTFDDGEPF